MKLRFLTIALAISMAIFAQDGKNQRDPRLAPLSPFECEYKDGKIRGWAHLETEPVPLPLLPPGPTDSTTVASVSEAASTSVANYPGAAANSAPDQS